MQETQESVEKFFVDYNYLKEEVYEADNEEEDRELKDDDEEKYVTRMMSTDEQTDETKPGRMKRDLKDICKVVHRQRSQVADIICICEESGDKEKFKEDSSVMAIVQAGLRDGKEDLGEYLYSKINEMKGYLKGTGFELVPGMIQGIFTKMASYLTPQDMRKIMTESTTGPSTVTATATATATPVATSKGLEVIEVDPPLVSLSEEEKKIRKAEIRAKGQLSKIANLKKSGSGFPEIGLFVTSTVLANGKRAYCCPIDGCEKGFVSPHTCDAHINRHLGWEYGPCLQCEQYSFPSRDSYDKHRCFAGLKTGGRRPPSRGRGSSKRPVSSSETGATAPKK